MVERRLFNTLDKWRRRYEPKSSSMVKMIEALECVSCFCISSAV
jgi:hypothetical protein